MPGPRTTEDDIINDISNMSGDQFEETSDEGDSGGGEQLPDTRAPAEDATRQLPRDVPGRPTPTDAEEGDKPAPRIKPNERGDLVDERGNVIATRGPERRLHQQTQRLTENLRQSQEQLNNTTTRMQQLERTLELPRSLGFNDEDFRTALQAYSVFKQNPPMALRQLIQDAVAKGHTLEEILGAEADIKSNIETPAVKQMLDAALAPLRQREQRERVQADAGRAAENEFRNFVSNYPDALLHETELTRVMAQERRPGEATAVTAERAYLKLQNWALTQGYDFTQPLGPQIMQRLQGGNVGAQPGMPAQQQPRPMPHGRSYTGQRDLAEETEPVSADTPWDQIVREAQRAGKGR